MAITWNIHAPEVRAHYARLTDPAYAREPFKYVFQIRIDLPDDDWPLWRRLHVPENYTLWDLYVAINSAIDWDPTDDPKFIVVQHETFEKIAVRGDCLWEHPIESYFSLEHPRSVCEIGSFEMHIKMEAVLPRAADIRYPFSISGAGQCIPDRYLKDGTPVFDTFNPSSVVFEDPDDKWIQVFCDLAFADGKANPPRSRGRKNSGEST